MEVRRSSSWAPLALCASLAACVVSEPSPDPLELRAAPVPAGTLGALDVTTPRTLPYELRRSGTNGEVHTTDIVLEFADGEVTTSLLPWFGVPHDATFDIDPSGRTSRADDGAVPYVFALLHAMPDGPVGLGTQWETVRPSDAEAQALDAVVQQSRREYTVAEAWDTDQGLVLRVEVAGSVRWVENQYMVDNFDGGLPLDERPEHFGFVDVNVSTGTVIDAEFSTGLGITAATAQQIPGDAAASIIRLCPGAGATFSAMADVCP
ncbi:MAG: hypothetical protein AB1Z98_36090 [Nannocystaceae bacterium]